MAVRRTGTVVDKDLVAPGLLRFRLMPENGNPFAGYEAGQHIALHRDDCKLTRKLGTGQDGKPVYEPECDPWGRQTVGPVTHSYSIASAPADTAEHGWLEFLVGCEHGVYGLPGRLNEALFGVAEEPCCEVFYHDSISGAFTLAERTDSAMSVLLVGTGTGVAPFVSMIKQLHAVEDGSDGRRYTLIHASRTQPELAYDGDLFEIEGAGRFDFTYVPTVSRPSRSEDLDPRIGQGRASNLVRHIYGLPTAEEEKLNGASNDVAHVAASLAVERLVSPILPRHLSAATLRERVDPSTTVLLACGNPASVADIKSTASRREIRFEQEEY